MRSGAQHIQIDQRGRGRTSSRAGAGLVAARGYDFGARVIVASAPVEWTPAPSLFVRGAALALTNGGRQLPLPAGGRQLPKPHFKKPVCHGALHLSHALGATASGGDGDRSRTPSLKAVVQGLREPVLDFHSFYPIRETPASRANEKALPEMRTSA